MKRYDALVAAGWAGFIDGKIDLAFSNTTPNYSRIYRTRKEARALYMDVRHVFICVAASGERTGKEVT